MPRFILSVLTVLAALGSAQETADAETVLRVNGVSYDQADFEKRFEFHRASVAGQRGVPLDEETRAQFDALRPEYLDQLATEAVVQQVGRRLGLSPDEAFIEQQLERLRADFDTEEAYLTSMREAGIRDEDFLRVLVTEAELSRRTIAALQEGVEIKDYQVQVFYDANRAQLQREAETCARHLLVETLEQAQTLAAELAAGADFETVARENSLDPGSAEQGGDLGCFGAGRMVPEFEAAAFATELNTVSEPVESEFGFHLILPYERTEASAVPLAEVEEAIRAELSQQIVRQAVEGYVENADIEKFEDRLGTASGG